MALYSCADCHTDVATDESPEGGPESRLWAAGAGRGQGARIARPTENPGATPIYKSKNSNGERGRLIGGPVYAGQARPGYARRAKARCKDRKKDRTKIRSDARCR